MTDKHIIHEYMQKCDVSLSMKIRNIVALVLFSSRYLDFEMTFSFLGENANINVTRYDPLVLECRGRSVSWSSYTNVGSSTILFTKPNPDGIRTSWLVYENATQSESLISCYRSGQYTEYYNVKVFGESD